MPAYDYLEEDGKIVTRVVPVASRDNWPGRVVIPKRIHVCPRGEPTQGESVIKGFRTCEERYGTAAVRRTEAALGLNASKVKKIWNEA